ncbi:head maturation protease, ClpP-related [Streptomyces virginiae]|uniref:head maturation protease, ClpP-related n=1 Tax=Streptomyces TaxID=1883 RepID=UPI00093F3845|nr:head maturation protease, ClpP-related [Streptomyces sp. MJM1172]
MHKVKTARPSAQLREGRNDWYRIKNLGGGAAEVAIYDEIGWFGVTAADLINELKSVTASEITVRLNSPGGDVFDGIAILNALRSHAARITVSVDGLAASIASVIAMAGDRVVMQPQSQLMIHDAMSLCVGNAADMAEMAEQLNRQSDNIASVYASRAGGSPEEWRDRMRNETWYTAQEAVDAGLADEVAPLPKEREKGLVAASWDLSIFNFASREQAPSPVLATRDATPEPSAPAPHEAAPPVFAFDSDVFRAAVRAGVTDSNREAVK